jgi:hypothetical protein
MLIRTADTLPLPMKRVAWQHLKISRVSSDLERLDRATIHFQLCYAIIRTQIGLCCGIALCTVCVCTPPILALIITIDLTVIATQSLVHGAF